MGKFLDFLDSVDSFSDDDNYQTIEDIKSMIQNLPLHVRKMIIIAEFQDELLGMGFEWDGYSCTLMKDYPKNSPNTYPLCIEFDLLFSHDEEDSNKIGLRFEKHKYIYLDIFKLNFHKDAIAKIESLLEGHPHDA